MYRLLNADGKTVARLLVARPSLDGSRPAGRASTGSATPQPVPLPPRLTITAIRGYLGQARRAVRLVAAVPGLQPAVRPPFADALRALGRRPGDYSNKVDADITAAHARVGGRRGHPAAPARHHRGERARRARGHRHGVPARPAGQRAADPQRAEAVRRRPGRPARRGTGAVRRRVQVGRRPDDADQGPGRAPARLRGDGARPRRGEAGRPRAVPRLPGAAAAQGVPRAQPRAALGAVRRRSCRSGGSGSPRSGRMRRSRARAAATVPDSSPATPRGRRACSPRSGPGWPSRRSRRRGAAITPDTPAEALHDLRKRCKELRYALEFFAPLHDPAGYAQGGR